MKINREAWKPCPRCQPRRVIPKEGCRHEFIIQDDGLFMYDTAFGWEGVTIDFCPWCGRPLTEKAWEILEKRLGGAYE